MPCYYPVSAYRSWTINPNTGKRSIVFNSRAALDESGREGDPLTLACGRCVGCRLERSRQWAVRCMHEASLYDRNCFITLTYDDEHLPKDGSLVLSDYQKFMKRLRKRFGEGIRFYMCGEYGDENNRPHYHACIFNFDFEDKVPIKEGLYLSESLQQLWDKGFCTVGSVTFESAAYVARYIMKKVLGTDDKAQLAREAKYYELDKWGEVLAERKPEFTTMSRRPGIGRGWFEKWSGDVFPRDYVVVRGKRASVPKYYEGLFALDNEEVMLQVKGKREEEREKKADYLWEESSPSRLATREFCQVENMKQLKRSV